MTRNKRFPALVGNHPFFYLTRLSRGSNDIRNLNPLKTLKSNFHVWQLLWLPRPYPLPLPLGCELGTSSSSTCTSLPEGLFLPPEPACFAPPVQPAACAKASMPPCSMPSPALKQTNSTTPSALGWNSQGPSAIRTARISPAGLSPSRLQ